MEAVFAIEVIAVTQIGDDALLARLQRKVFLEINAPSGTRRRKSRRRKLSDKSVRRHRRGPHRTETIKGEVTGVAFDEYRVAIFSYADGRWWPQPFLNNQQTRLDSEGKFTTRIHLGTRYAAALVSSSFPPQSAELFDLPNVGGDVLAMDFADPDETRTGMDEPASAALAEGQTAASSSPVSAGRILGERLGIPSLAAVLAEVLSLVSQLLGAALSWLLWALLIFAGLVCILTFLVLITAI